jgi:hypothetical protein
LLQWRILPIGVAITISRKSFLPDRHRAIIFDKSDKETCSAVTMTRVFAAENDVSDHKFKVGQSVLYTSGPYGGGTGGIYKITQLLPADGDDRQYRIKSADEPHERVVKESQLDRDS